MADKRWVILAVGGVGDVAVWVDEEAIKGGEHYVECENLTKLIAGPQGIGLAKIAPSAVINMALVAFMIHPEPEFCANLSKVWDMKNIVLPSPAERKRFTVE